MSDSSGASQGRPRTNTEHRFIAADYYAYSVKVLRTERNLRADGPAGAQTAGGKPPRDAPGRLRLRGGLA